MKEKTTAELLEMLQNVANTKRLYQLLEEDYEEKNQKTFVSEINKILDERKIEKCQLIQEAGIQRNYGYQILSGKRKPGRDKVIAISLALQLNLEETQRMLKIAGEGNLYSKVKRDAIIIFSIERNLKVIEANELLFNMEEEPLQ